MSLQQAGLRPADTVVARRWIFVASALFVLGAVAPSFFPEIYDRLAATSSAVPIRALTVLITLIQWGSFATGAALLGAAPVILRLTQPADDEPEEPERFVGDQ